MTTTDISYAAVFLCGRSAPLPASQSGAAALGALLKHGGDAVEVERLTTTWVGTLGRDQPEQWSRVTAPSHEPETTTYWQVLRWKDDEKKPEFWTYDAYSKAVAAARDAFEDSRAARVMVTRVVCERLGVITRTGHVYGPALRRLVAAELKPASPATGEREVA